MEHTSMKEEENILSPKGRIIKAHMESFCPLKRDDSIWWIRTDKEDFHSTTVDGEIITKKSFSTKWQKLIPLLDKENWLVEELLKRIGGNPSGEKMLNYLETLLLGREIEVEEKFLNEGDITQNGYIVKRSVFQHRILSVETCDLNVSEDWFESFRECIISKIEEDFPLEETPRIKQAPVTLLDLLNESPTDDK